MNMSKKIFLLSVFILFISAVRADEPVRFKASAPSTVVLDEPFQLVYSVNANGRDLRLPEIKNFDLLAGPFTSTMQSSEYVNGRMTSSVENSYTYTIQAQKTGTFTIPSATIVVNGQKYVSNGLSIKVLPPDKASQRSSQQGGGTASGGVSRPSAGGSSSQSVSNDNIFIRANVTKTNVYEQEAILVTYKLYSVLDVNQIQNKKMPDFNGFLKQEIDQPQNKQLSMEHYNGRNYGTAVLYQVLLYPQHSGKIKIDDAVFQANIRVQNRTQVRSIFDDFFDSYSNVNKTITVPGVVVNVNSLPANKPASFNGTVGHFTINSTISSQKVRTNDAVTLRMTIAGSGNMKLIKTPDIKFPDGFEAYDPKVTNNFKTNSSGVSGSKTIEFMFIPRHSGSYEIPSTEISYFDVQDKAYKTLKTPTYQIDVEKGVGGDNNSAVVSNYVDKEDVKQLAKDIRYIQTDNIKLTRENEPLAGTVTGWLMFLLPLLLAAVLFVFFRKQARENADIRFMKNKRANKVAVKRLKLAQKLLSQGNKDKFYDEVLKAVWNYLGDKLSIPVASLTKENVAIELTERGVDDELYQRLVNVLNTCEFARYAPNSGQQEMGNLYDETIDVISKLEETTKRK